MMEELIESYFLDGYTNVEILGFLAIQHNIYMSVSTLKRRLKEKNLRRRISKQNEDRAAIGAEVARHLFGSGSNLGYRKICSILKKMGIAVNRNTVMEIVRELDPEGVSTRKKKRLRRRIYSVPGPDFLWHIDGYDKLKPYGFSIHGCIDLFSRKIIWMKVSPSNKDPNIIVAYFLSAVKENAAVPTKIRSDDGTENSLIEPIQITLRAEHDDEFAGLASYAIGTSPSNQRIESLWSQFTKDRPMWWRQFFSELSSFGFVNSSSYVVKECLRFCFMHILRKELDEFKERWNRHLIAKSKGASLPTGRPNSLYHLPQLYGTKSYKMSVDLADEEFDNPNFAQNRPDNC